MGRPPGGLGDPLAGPPRRLCWSAPAGRISSAAVRRDRLRVGLEGLGGEGGSRLRPRALQRPSARTRFAASRGRGLECSLRPLGSAGCSPLVRFRGRCGGVGPGTGPPAPGATVDRGVLSSVRPDRVASPWAGTGPRQRRQGSAAMSATHPTRLETRTKESNARASQRAPFAKPRGAMKVRAGARRLRWDPGHPLGVSRPGAPPARLVRPVGEVERERVR